MTDTDHIVDRITRAREQLLDTIAGLTDEQMAASPDGDWSIREILHHVGIGEEANVELAQRALAGNPVSVDGFDLDAWNVEQVARRADGPASEAIDRLHRAREKTLVALESLSEDDLTVRLEHPGCGEMTIEQLFRALGTHDLMHRRDILRRIEQYGAQ